MKTRVLEAIGLTLVALGVAAMAVGSFAAVVATRMSFHAAADWLF